MFKTLVSVLVALLASVGVACAEDWRSTDAEDFRKIAANALFNKGKCSTVKPPVRADACRNLQQQLANNANAAASALQMWEMADNNGKKSVGWDAKRKYYELLLVRFQLIRTSWAEMYLGGVWDPATNTSVLTINYAEEIASSKAVRDDFCPSLPADRAEPCKKEWGDYLVAMEKVLSAGTKLNDFRKRADKEAYYNTYVELRRLVLDVVNIEIFVKQKYLN